jgi:ribonuclease T2
MNRNNNPLSRMTLPQILGLIAVVLVASVIELWGQGASPDPSALVPGAGSANVTVTTAPGGPTPVSLTGLADFDYFVLALSWSPDYCAGGGANDAQECAIGKKLSFVLHGLWPQNDPGYPSDCTSEKLPASLKAQFPGLYPNDALYDHEWEKHGTCTGLDPARYLALAAQLRWAVTIPENFRSPAEAFRTTVAQVRQDFVQANPGFAGPDFEVYCSGSGRYLTQVYACFTRQGQPVACGTSVHTAALKSCQSADFIVRNTR